jgi:quinol monooxygenase YgiN
MLVIVGTFRLAPAKLADAIPLMALMIEASRAENGCEEYSYASDVFDVGLVHVTERWRDRAALDCHLASKHIAAWRSTWCSLEIGHRDLRVYEVGKSRSVELGALGSTHAAAPLSPTAGNTYCRRA